MKNKPDRAIVVPHTTLAGGLRWTTYDVMRAGKVADLAGAGETLSPSPFRHKHKAQAWAADWNRKNLPKAAEVKAARRKVALIERFVVPVFGQGQPIEVRTVIQLRRMYGDKFANKYCEARALLCECREIVLDAEKKEPEPTT